MIRLDLHAARSWEQNRPLSEEEKKALAQKKTAAAAQASFDAQVLDAVRAKDVKAVDALLRGGPLMSVKGLTAALNVGGISQEMKNCLLTIRLKNNRA